MTTAETPAATIAHKPGAATVTEAPTIRRDRYAAAIRQCIRDHTWPALTASDPPRFGATEYDLADAVLALADQDAAKALRARADELDQLGRDLSYPTRLTDTAPRLSGAHYRAAADFLDGERHVDIEPYLTAFLTAVRDASTKRITPSPVPVTNHDVAESEGAQHAQPSGVITWDGTLTPAQSELLRAAFPMVRLAGRIEFAYGGHTWRYQPAAGRCCVCGDARVTYRNYRDQPFCHLCANCGCGRTPCIRTAPTED